MKVQLSMILAFGVLAGASAFANQANDAELKKLQGTWQMVSVEEGGVQSVPDGTEPDSKLIITGNKFRFQGQKEEGTLTIDATKNLKSFDAEFEFFGKTCKRLGIYKIEGDTVMVCFVPASDSRPAEFTTAGNPERILFVMKRVQHGQR